MFCFFTNLAISAGICFCFYNGVSWNNGSIDITEASNDKSKTVVEKNAPALLVNNIAGNNTIIHFDNKTTSTTIKLKTIIAKSLSKQTNQPFQFEGLALSGSNATVDLPDEKIQCEDFFIKDGVLSNLQHIVFKEKTENGSVLIIAPLFSFIPFINKTIESKAITIDSVAIVHPAIVVSLRKTLIEKLKQPFSLPTMDVKNVSVTDASVRYDYANTNNKMNAVCDKLAINIKSIFTQKDESLLLNSASFHFNNVEAKMNDSISFKSEGDLYVAANTFLFDPALSAWKIQLDAITADSINYTIIESGNKRIALNISSISAENIFATNTEVKEFLPWLINRSKATITLGNIHWLDDNTNLQVNHFEFNQPKKQISIHSLSIDPGKSREDFISQLIYREDYMQATSGEIKIEGIEMDKGLLHIPSATINNPVLNIYSDKLKLSGPETIQLLPVKSLMQLQTELQLDSVHLNNMAVHYTELNAETKQTGHVYFTHVNGDVKNISTKPIADNLSVNVSAKFLDTIQLHLAMKESYTDPKNGLELKLQLGPANLRLLNSFLPSLVSMDVHSGYLDTMYMQAFGNEYLSHGTMRLYYHNLNAVLLDSGNMQHQTTGRKLMNFFANAFAIKNSNDKRQADFSFVRNRQKSFISYLLAMIVQGAAKNVAPLTGISYRKEYKKQLKNISKENTQ